MHTVIRSYSGATTLVEELTKHRASVESLIQSVPGFIAYYLVKTSDGAISITVCESLKGCEESTQRAANWLRENLPNLKLAPPQVQGGDLAFRFANYTAKTGA